MKETSLRTTLFFPVLEVLNNGIKPALFSTSTFTTNKRLIYPGRGLQTQMNAMNYGASKKTKQKDTPDDAINFPFSVAKENVKSEQDAKN